MVAAWLRGPFDAACTRLFAKDRLDSYGVLSSGALSDGRFREWLRADPNIVWHAFALAAWCEVNLGGGPDSLRELIDESEQRAAVAAAQ